MIIPAEHPIEVRLLEGSARFWNTENDSEFTVRGANYFWIVPHDGGFQDRFFAPGNFDATRIQADFSLLASKGYNTVRIFLDTCNDGPDCIGKPGGEGLNPAYIANIVRTIEIARDTGIYLILTSNDLPDSGGYWEISNSGANEQFEGYRNAHYLTPQGITSARKYWGDLLKAVYDGGAPLEHILAWSILNEQWYFRDQPPFSLTSGSVTTANGNSYDMGSDASKKSMAVEGMVYYIEKVRDVIDTYDPYALVTMGFFAPNYPNPIGLGDFRYVETADLLYQADLDFFDFHAYPGEDPLFPLAENYGMLGYEQKPIILGEFGCFLDRYPDLEDAVAAMQGYQAESCGYGFDGWLHWGMYMAPTGIGDATWGFMDADQEMLEGLAPVNYPDACDENLLLPENLALGKPATASAYLNGETPAMAVDGNYDSQWGSGSGPVQWLQVDLEASFELTEINLWVAQFPDGLEFVKNGDPV